MSIELQRQRRAVLTLMIIGALIGTDQNAKADLPKEPIEIGHEPQFLFDTYIVDNHWPLRRNREPVRLIFHPPKKHAANPLLRGRGTAGGHVSAWAESDDFADAMARAEDVHRDSTLGIERFTRARAAYEQALAYAGKPSQRGEALLGLARTYRDRHLYPKAIELYRQVVEIDADEIEPARRVQAQLLIGRSYLDYDWYPEAAEAFVEAATMDGATTDERVEAYHRAGGALEAHRDFEAAKKAYERAVEIGRASDGDVQASLNGIGDCLRGLGQPDEAIAHLEGLLADDALTGRDVVSAHKTIARALQDLGQHERAIERFELVKEHPSATGYDPKHAARGIKESRSALESGEPNDRSESVSRDRGVLNALLVSRGHKPVDEDAGFVYAGVPQSRDRLTIGDGDIYAGEPRDIVEIGTRTELMVDRWLIDSQHNLSLVLNRPQRREVVLEMNQPWERRANAVGYVTVFRDGNKIRMYYRAHGDRYCYAESEDGITFEKPALDLFSFGEHEKTNIIIGEGPEGHNFTPFKDTRPGVPEDQAYKAIGGRYTHAFQSRDGIEWEKMRDERVLGGRLDSQNVAFWDPRTRQYLAYGREWTDDDEEGGRRREIRSWQSDDFLNWKARGRNVYPPNAPLEHLYTNATVPAPGAEHVLLAFPRRFVHHRRKVTYTSRPAVGEAVFLSSRDGIHWDRSFREAWLRPGRDFRNWTGGNVPAWGIVPTGPDEMSMYIAQHHGFPSAHLRRLTIPRRRFASWQAGYKAGELVTRPLVFEGKHLILNYSTSAAGSVFVEIQDKDGVPIEGFALEDMSPLYGDTFDEVVSWNGDDDLSRLAGKAVRIRVLMQDADLYSLRFAEDQAPQRFEW